MPTLEQTLVDILNKTTALMEQGFNFAEDQLPDIIYQLLLWYGTYNFIIFVTGIIILTVFYYGSYKWITVVEPTLEDFRWLGTGFGVIPGGFILHLIVFSEFLNLTWLKIWIAPKIWLIEYTASLMKGS